MLLSTRKKPTQSLCQPYKSQHRKSLAQQNSEAKNAQKEHLTQRRQHDNGHFSSDDKRIVAKQTLTQTLKDKLRQAREEGAPAHAIAGLGKSHAKEKHELLKLQHHMRQKIVTDAVASSASVQNHQRTSPHSMLIAEAFGL